MGQPVVLLVHYDPKQVRALQGALESSGFTVHACTDGETALRTFPDVHPDVVVVEAMIPRRNGFEVCRDLKATEEGQRTPVVITSGVFRSMRHRNEALHTYGCQEFLGRGFSPADLIRAVRSLLPGAFVKGGRPAAPAPVHRPSPPHTAASSASEHEEAPVFSDILAELSEEADLTPPPRPPAGPHPRLADHASPASLLSGRKPLGPAGSIESLDEGEIASWLDHLFPTSDSGTLAEQLQEHADSGGSGVAPDDGPAESDVPAEFVVGAESQHAEPAERSAPVVATGDDGPMPEAVADDEEEDAIASLQSAGAAVPVSPAPPVAAAAAPERTVQSPASGTVPPGRITQAPEDEEQGTRFELDMRLLEEPDTARRGPTTSRSTSVAPRPGKPGVPSPAPRAETASARTDSLERSEPPRREERPEPAGARSLESATARADDAADHPSALLEQSVDQERAEELETAEGPVEATIGAEEGSTAAGGGTEGDEDDSLGEGIYGENASGFALPFPDELEDEAGSLPASAPAAAAPGFPDLDPRRMPDVAPPPAPRFVPIDLAENKPAVRARVRRKVAAEPVEDLGPLTIPVKRRSSVPLSVVTLAVALAAAGGWFLFRDSFLPGAPRPADAAVPGARSSARHTREQNASVGGSLAYLGGESPQADPSAAPASPGSAEQTEPASQAGPAPVSETNAAPDSSRRDAAAAAVGKASTRPAQTTEAKLRASETKPSSRTAPSHPALKPSGATPSSTATARSTAGPAPTPAERAPHTGKRQEGRAGLPLAIVEADGRTVLPAKGSQNPASDAAGEPSGRAAEPEPRAASPRKPAESTSETVPETPAPAAADASGEPQRRSSGTASAPQALPAASGSASPKPAGLGSEQDGTVVMVASAVQQEPAPAGGRPAEPRPDASPQTSAAPPAGDPARDQTQGRSESPVPALVGAVGTAPASTEPVPIERLDARPAPVSRRAPAYPAAARTLRISGEVRLQVLVLEDGTVGEVRIVRSPSPTLSAAASTAAMSWRYRPAMAAGRPVKTWLTESVTFSAE